MSTIALSDLPKLRVNVKVIETTINDYEYQAEYRVLNGSIQVSSIRRMNVYTEDEFGAKLEELDNETYNTIVSRIKDIEEL